MERVSLFKLQQNGGYKCRIEFIFTDENGQTRFSPQTEDILFDRLYTVSPGSLGITEGTTVRLKIFVVEGFDIESGQAFIYDAMSPLAAAYTSSGTNLVNLLTLDSVQ